MGAPAKTTGGKRNGTDTTPGSNGSRSGDRSGTNDQTRASHEDLPERRPTRGRTSTKQPPKGHTSYTTHRTPPRSSGPPRYRSGSVKPLLLGAALEAAASRGYQAVRITDITDPANVTRQAFYSHFRDKRHCLCEALDSRLAAIERVAAAAIEADTDLDLDRVPTPAHNGAEPPSQATASPLSPEWPNEIIDTIDELLGEHFGSTEGTKGRLIEALAIELEQTDNLPGVRIGSLIKRARVPQGDFYRHFSGKRACFSALYEQRLNTLMQDSRLAAQSSSGSERRRSQPSPSGRGDLTHGFGEALASDRARARLLLLGEGELPARDDPTAAGSCRGALAGALAGLLGIAEEPVAPLLVGSLIEVSRSALLGGDLRNLGRELAALAEHFPQLTAAQPSGERHLRAVTQQPRAA